LWLPRPSFVSAPQPGRKAWRWCTLRSRDARMPRRFCRREEVRVPDSSAEPAIPRTLP